MAQVVRVKDEERTGGVPPSPGTRAATAAPEFLRRPAVWVSERIRRTRQFLHEVRVELRHVTWPSRTDVRSTTIVVLITVAFFGLYFFLLDYGIAQIVNLVFERFRP
ncbi:MAG: preprotein translocase subunit SecE [Firmicutes bacterium]|nr:preprotein translocase subunit SecE [Bacillota bacterium]